MSFFAVDLWRHLEELIVTAVVLDAGIKAAILLGITAFAARALRDSSAAVRHRLWCLSLVGAIMKFLQ